VSVSCPSCKSDRCGNHAACARKSEQKLRDDLKTLFSEVLDTAEKIKGGKLTAAEARYVCERTEELIWQTRRERGIDPPESTTKNNAP
jgi:hypothetical protein